MRTNNSVRSRFNQLSPASRCRSALPGAVILVSLLAVGNAAHAVNATWNGATDAVWATTTNWSTSPVPGTGNIATFDNAGGVVDVIDLGGGVTINTIEFTTAATAAYTIGSGAVNSQTLTLNDGSAINVFAVVTNNQLFNAALVLGTANGNADFTIANTASGTTATELLTFAGDITGSSTFTGVKNLNVTGAQPVIISGVIANGATSTVKLSKTNTTASAANLLTLSGANTYSGDTAISANAGTLALDNVNAIQNSTLDTGAAGTQSVTFTVAGTNTYNLGGLKGADNLAIGANTISVGANGQTTSYSGALSSTGGGLTKTGSGTTTLSGANGYNGGTTLSQGTLVASTSASALGSGAVTLGDTGTGANNIQLTLSVSPSNNITVSNNGTGTATIFGNVLFGGQTGTITLNRAAIFEIPNTGMGDWHYGFGGGGVSGTGPLTIKGGGGGTSAAAAGNRLILGANNSGFSGGVTVQSGAFQPGDANAAGSGSITLGNASSSSAVTQLRLNANIGNTIIVSSSAPSSAAGIGTANSLQVLSGALQVDRALTINGGSDRLTWSGAGAVWSGSGGITISGGRVTHDAAVNTWTGNMTINSASIFQTGSASTLTSANSVAVNGTLQLSNFPQTINGLTGTGTVQNITGANTLTVGAGGANASFSGVLQNGSGAMSLIKSGGGTQTLSGANITYTGSTSVNNGRLVLSGSGVTFASSSYSILSGAVLELNATSGLLDTTAAGVTFSGAGTLLKTGGGTFRVPANAGTFSLGAGSLIDVQAGVFDAGSNANENWASNLSSLNIAGSASIDEISYSAAQFDALTGSGTMIAGGSATVTLGANNTAAGTYNAAGTATFSGVITGAAAITKIGSGTQTLSGTNSYSGETHVNDGTLIITGSASNTTTGIMEVNNGELHLGKTGGALVAAGNLFLQIGDGAAGSATVKLLAPNQTSNDGIDVTIDSDGKFDLNGYDQTINNLNGGFIFSTVDGQVSGLPPVIPNTLTVKTGDFSGVIQNSVGTLTLVKDSSGSLVLTGPNAYSGTTAIRDGTLAIGGDNDRLPTGTTVTLGDSGTSGTLRLADMIDPTARNQTLAGLLTSGTGTNNRVTGGGAGISVLTLDIAGTNTFGGILGGSGPNHNNLGLTKTGVGTLELTGANTYSGATIIDSGTLWLNGTAGFSHSGSGTYVVGNGGTLKGDGNLEDHAITFATGSTGAPGNSPGLMPAGSQSWDDNSTYEWEVAQAGTAGVDYDTYAVSGLLDFSAISGTMTLELIKWPGGSIALTDTFALWTYGALTGWDAPDNVASGKFTLVSPNNSVNYSSAYVYNDGAGTIWLTGIYVPEPSTYALGLLGLAGLGLVVWRRRKALGFGT